jgi:hypothetical protein
MSKIRKSFILHHDSLNVLDDLTDDQAGLLFKAIKAYHLGDELTLDVLTNIAMSPFRNQFDRDALKYEKLCEKNRLIAETRYNTKSTTGKTGNQPLPEATKSTDNDSKSDSKSKSDNDSNSKKEVTKDIVTSVPKFNFKNELLALGVDKDVLEDWMIVRTKKKSSNTKTALKGLLTEVEKAGIKVPDAIKISAENSWSGFKASWYSNLSPSQQAKSTHTFEQQNYTSGKF